ncbi:MAG: EamA family transporter RarD [Paraglaciecola sp.]|uniref:EamA family transporter RarD n=1 Tax=Paraglaciecola sp. TaxID=1920173 RepID=UPI00273D876E|nr:EamA family transporter RarD [Paraglaciecola sp.]MDP5031540.1 EamA family transporter RarD [Paraglaciecola sp.]MDP5132555.1 EamA family transporter RarD [Paraglaciecola sp.]
MNDKTIKSGVLFALAAYAMWGFAPLYFKLLQALPAQEILMHRVIWSVLVLCILVIFTGKFTQVKIAAKNIKVMSILLLSGLLLAVNWLIFIWAINNGHLLDGSLGYYINPLLNVFLGRLFLQERLRPLQKAAVALAFIGVSILVISFGQVPWIALSLAATFGIYGLLRKKVAVDSLPGLLLETMMMLPFALIYWYGFSSELSDLTSNSLSLNVSLICAGIVTTAPLLCFTGAARRLRYSTLGFFQYLGPSIMFVIAVWWFNEALDMAKITTFAFVWLALAMFSFDSYRAYRSSKKQAAINATIPVR